MKMWSPFFINFSLLKGLAHIVHICLSVKSQLFLYLSHSSNSTAESEPVVIWVVLILKQNLET